MHSSSWAGTAAPPLRQPMNSTSVSHGPQDTTPHRKSFQMKQLQVAIAKFPHSGLRDHTGQEPVLNQHGSLSGVIPPPNILL